MYTAEIDGWCSSRGHNYAAGLAGLAMRSASGGVAINLLSG